ncbi:lipase family protein [Microbulbifer halophilus]|uniref:Lipase family protein n=1 Tax=Microbulbifer halophilus TaxID=453963 RepID=A0ABW5EEH3_9GAMM|nr:lipase family protein [Microbulbifer halophilus]MCW8127633.1 lipase family protein [Microbulbifer halophilus]
MSLISNKDAASLASVVYEIENTSFEKRTIDRFKTKWDFSNHGDVVNGSSGTLWVIKKETGFGVIAQGKGEFENDLLILLRGTSNAFDWATDGTVGFSPSETGRFVHTGFNKCFGSMLPELKEHLSKIKGSVRTIHCIGHSLGGALATLTVEWLKKSNFVSASKIKLYTFGSPRVGAHSFAKLVTQDLSQGKDIYRVYHKSDVVPMVPMWPFYHIPEKSGAFCLDNYVNPGDMISFADHKMENYVKSISKISSWKTMPQLEPEVSESAIERWLSSDGPISFTFNTMNMIHRAIAYVISKVLKLTGISVQFGIASGVTLLDLLAYVLKKGIDFSKSLSGWIYKLIVRIMSALGMKIKKDIQLTTQFIRYIFTTLKNKVDRLVQAALHGIFDH